MPAAPMPPGYSWSTSPPAPSGCGRGPRRCSASEACLNDVPVRGAAAYARRAHATGVQLVYLTARPERMRPGTEEVLRRFGFPLPGEGVALWMKPDDPSIGDDAFKPVS